MIILDSKKKPKADEKGFIGSLKFNKIYDSGEE